jgi:hypothetical protein
MRRMARMACCVGLLLATGCTSSIKSTWLGPWQPMSLGPEEYRRPPDEQRYAGPQSYPKNVMTPTLQKETTFDPRDFQGGLGSMRPSSTGTY